MQSIVFHLPRSWLGPTGTGLLPFYERLTAGLADQGVPFRLTALDRDSVMQTVSEDRDFHVINHGQFEHPRVLNAGIAYVYPFWNMDPKGIRAFSSIADARFLPDQIDPDVARPFFRKLRQRLVDARTSRYEQPQERMDLPAQCTAVFLQSEGHRVVGETCFLDRWEMLETVLNNSDLSVVVKPHPRDSDPQTRVRLETLQKQYENFQIVDCNIHDLLRAAARVVTINSAVGIEAYLHRKPVILCGQSDFHHIAEVARTPAELARALSSAPKRRAYDKFIWWYFAHHCLSTTEPNLTERFLARVRRDS